MRRFLIVLGWMLLAVTTGMAQSNVGGGTSGGSSTGGFFGNSKVIDTSGSPYNTPIGNTVPDVTFTNGQNTIDCTFNNDCNFVAGTDNGKICYGTNMTTDVTILTGTTAVLPEGVLTVTGAQTATCSGGNSTATTIHNGVFVWGKDGATALNTAWAACILQNGCVFQLPAGLVLVESAGVGNATCGGSNANTPCAESGSYSRIQVRGWGQVISQLAPTPNFAGTNCTGGPVGDTNGCFFSGGAGINFSDMGIFGAGQSTLGAGFNGKIGIILSGSIGYNNYVNSITLFSWGSNTAGFTGIKAEGESGATFHDVHLDGMGSLGCWFHGQFTSTLYTLEGSYCAVNGGTSGTIDQGQLSSHGGIYGWNGAGTTIVFSCVNSQTLCSFFGDEFPYITPTSSNYLVAASGGRIYADGVEMGDGASAAQMFETTGSGSQIYARDITFFNGSSSVDFFCNGSGSSIYSEGGSRSQNSGTNGFILNNVAGCTFSDEGRNTYVSTQTPNINSGSIQGSNTLNGSCTGTATAASTLGFFGLGDFAVQTCTSVVTNIGQVMNHAGTITGLTVTSTAGGVNASSGVVTILKNNAATASTCTMGVALRCTDLTHQVTFVAGDIISAQFTTQALETLANMKANVWVQ